MGYFPQPIAVPPSYVDTPGSIARALVASGLLQRADAEGKRSGNWVLDTTLLTLLESLCREDVAASAVHATSSAARRLLTTYLSEEYDLRVCYLDAATGSVDIPDPDAIGAPCRNMLLLVTHTTPKAVGLHYNAIIVNARHRLVHVFDTTTKWTNKRARGLIREQFPSMDWRGYQVRVLCACS